MPVLPMFPIGSVLFPHMPLRLRVFEERYLIMLSELVKAGGNEFGVVLIERGQEVGGGEQRFSIGTTAAIAEVSAHEGFVGLVAQGHQRFRVSRWLEDDPHPEAEVDFLPEIEWHPEDQPLLDAADRAVRRALSVASEFVETAWPADVELADEPTAAVWQLAGIAPIGPLDQLALLRATSAADLLTRLTESVQAAATPFVTSWPDEEWPATTPGLPAPVSSARTPAVRSAPSISGACAACPAEAARARRRASSSGRWLAP